MSRRDIPDVQNSNFPLVYELEISLNLNDFDPDYPKDPQTLGEWIRKTRMDKDMTAKELAGVIRVSDTAILNWEIKGQMPEAGRMEKIGQFLAGQR